MNITTTSESSGNSWVTAAVVMGVLGVLVISILLTLYFCRRKKIGLCKRTEGNFKIHFLSTAYYIVSASRNKYI